MRVGKHQYEPATIEFNIGKYLLSLFSETPDWFDRSYKCNGHIIDLYSPAKGWSKYWGLGFGPIQIYLNVKYNE